MLVESTDGRNTPERPGGSNRYLYDANHDQIIGIDNSGMYRVHLLLFGRIIDAYMVLLNRTAERGALLSQGPNMLQAEQSKYRQYHTKSD